MFTMERVGVEVGGWGWVVNSNYSENNATFVAHLASQDFLDFKLS